MLYGVDFMNGEVGRMKVLDGFLLMSNIWLFLQLLYFLLYGSYVKFLLLYWVNEENF